MIFGLNFIAEVRYYEDFGEVKEFLGSFFTLSKSTILQKMPDENILFTAFKHAWTM